MKNIVKIRNVVFGEGIPKICIPLTDANIEELSKSVNELKSAPFDMVEWRADFFNDIEDPQKRFQAMSFLREQLGNTPILFTARTSVEGGKLDIDTEGIVYHLCQMQKLGADIVKYAVTPQCARDVLTLLDATLTMQEEHNETPVITMSMGGQGAVSRVCGSVFGSSITFGTAGNSSAPGQLPADLLSTFINNL